jgi:hypothetical protein
VEILKKILTILILIAIASTLILMMPSQVKANPSSTLSITNPGPASNPKKWNASAYNTDEIGGSNFTFYGPKTDVNSTFFINVTIAGVNSMKGWGVGVVFDNTTLQYVSVWRPSDHVFKGAEDLGVAMLAPAVAIEEYDATHQTVAWGCAYIMPDPPWTFNGTGTLCQMQFKIIAPVNATSPELSAIFDIDPAWTGIYLQPVGHDIYAVEKGYLNYIYDATPPQIDTPTQNPLASNVQENQPVLVSVNVTDLVSGVNNVTLYYTHDTTEYSLPMTLNNTNQLWQATIPGYLAGTNVKYKIQVYDKAGNSAVNDNTGAYFPYTVVPEFTTAAMLLVFASASLVAVIARKHNKKSFRRT